MLGLQHTTHLVEDGFQWLGLHKQQTNLEEGLQSLPPSPTEHHEKRRMAPMPGPLHLVKDRPQCLGPHTNNMKYEE